MGEKRDPASGASLDGTPDPCPSHVEKIMTISRAEFEASLSAFAPEAIPHSDGRWIVSHRSLDGTALATRPVCISWSALEAVRLGGLLALPSARITLDLQGLSAGEREDFLRRFEIAFQRGGG
jgi:hypothetical protein